MFSSCCGCSNKKSNKKALSDENNEENEENQADKNNVENQTDDCVEILLKDREVETTKKDVISQEPTNKCEVLPVEQNIQIGMNDSNYF